MARQFRNVGGLRPSRTAFPVTHEHITTGDMGILYPVFCQHVIPGDKWMVGNEVVLRFQPLVSPILHEVNVYVHYYFVPFRLLWDKWEEFMTGGEDGNDESIVPKWGEDIWNEAIPEPQDGNRWISSGANYIQPGTLFDRCGFGIEQSSYPLPHSNISLSFLPRKDRPVDFPRRAYIFIFNEYYRDQNLQKKYAFKESHYKKDPTSNDYILKDGYRGWGFSSVFSSGVSTGLYYRNWEKDYFTSSLPFVQRGTAPALPVSGLTNAVFNLNDVISVRNDSTNDQAVYFNGLSAKRFAIDLRSSHLELGSKDFSDYLTERNTVDLSTATTFNINDVRTAFQIQKWLERNARAGVRYTEFIKAHFGISPTDERLDRPEYIGGSKSPVIISEVLQTSSTTNTPQANMAGHGLVADSTRCVNYTVKESGLIMGIMSVMPRTKYQNGINRQWTFESKYDLYFREFANLGEQAILNKEIFATGDESINNQEFGFIPRYDEYRYIPSYSSGLMKLFGNQTGLNFWHLGRVFSSRPNLNESFIQMHGDNSVYKRIFAVPTQPGLIINVTHYGKMIRPMPFMGEPGLVDHF